MAVEEIAKKPHMTPKAGNAVILIALICFALCGCASPRTFIQAGASKETNSAKITCDSETNHNVLIGLNSKVYIASIDEKSTATFAGFMTDAEPYAQVAYVTPGRHYLDLKFSQMNSFAWGRVWLDAEAGKSYIIRKKAKNYAITFWVEEMDTGKIVGGIPGGEPESGDTPTPDLRRGKVGEP